MQREINLFYIDGNTRNRIVASSDGFEVLNTNIKFSKEEIISRLKNFPELFSPNVILRPLYQETVLPNVAYIGGPAEVAYWLELKSVFELHGVSYPVLMLRNCAMIVEASVAQRIEKLKLEIVDFFAKEDEIIKKFISEKDQHSFSVEAMVEKIS
ncbi:MAG: bacillithiol biosynthesis BshC [Bacteroidetes bacterium]|nr:bacillithiol biosynthesis BshC [Bacteroidota bacterium]